MYDYVEDVRMIMLPSHVIKIRFSSTTASLFIVLSALQLGQDQSICMGQNRSIINIQLCTYVRLKIVCQ